MNVLTIAKLIPLALFIAVGLAHADLGRVAPLPPVTVPQVAAAALLLIFVFGGFDVIAVPAGESSDPRRDVPTALVITVAVVTTVFTLAQAVATMHRPRSGRVGHAAGRLGPGHDGRGRRPAHQPRVDPGDDRQHRGPGARGLRYLYALAEQGDLPRWFAAVHPRFHTPSNATVFTTLVTLGLALSGSFAALASAAAVARLLVYAGTCGSTLALRSPRLAGRVAPATFVVPFGGLLPSLGVLVSVAVVGGASRQQLIGGGIFLAFGAALFAAARARGARQP